MRQASSSRHRPLRLAGYDYAQAGTYAFTVVVRGRRCCLGIVGDNGFQSGKAGEIVRDVWDRLPGRFPTILLDAFVVMPNHIHGIALLGANPGIVEEVAMNGDATGMWTGLEAPYWMPIDRRLVAS